MSKWTKLECSNGQVDKCPNVQSPNRRNLFNWLNAQTDNDQKDEVLSRWRYV